MLEMGDARRRARSPSWRRSPSPTSASSRTSAPVHLELMGSLEAIAAAKAELVAGLRPGGTAIVPAGEPLLEPHRRDDVTTVTFGPGGDVDEIDAEDGARAAVRPAPTCAATRSPRSPPRAPSASSPTACWTSRCRASAASGSTCPETSSSSTTATTPTRCRCAPHSTTSPRPRPGRRVAVLGDMLELGPDEARFHAEIGAHARAAGVDVLVAVGPRAAHFADGYGEVIALPDAQAAAAAVPELLEPGDTVLRQGLARRRPRGRRPRRWKPRPDGRGPHRGHRGAAHLHLPVAALHRRPAQPRVRPEHPRGGARGPPREGRHPDDGRDHHLPRDRGAVPDPVSDYDWRSVGVFGAAVACALLGFADDYTKIVRRRSLGLRARTKLLVTIAISLGLWWVATQKAGLQRHAAPALGRRHHRPRRLLPAAHLPRRGGDDQRGQPDRRPRRPRRRAARRSSCWPTSGSPSSPAASATWRCCARAWSAPASASCGSTPSRPRSSWATPARWGWAGRSPAWR